MGIRRERILERAQNTKKRMASEKHKRKEDLFLKQIIDCLVSHGEKTQKAFFHWDHSVTRFLLFQENTFCHRHRRTRPDRLFVPAVAQKQAQISVQNSELQKCHHFRIKPTTMSNSKKRDSKRKKAMVQIGRKGDGPQGPCRALRYHTPF